MNDTRVSRACKSHQPHSQWRSCGACSRIRQARIADIAEDLLGKWPSIAWVTLTPELGHRRTIDAIRDAYLRQAKTTSGIWTIEVGLQSGKLHANILTAHHNAPRTTGAEIHVQSVSVGLRSVAAYISKMSQVPDMGTYNGRTYGRWGMLSSWLTAPDMELVPKAAYIEHHLLPAALPGYAAALAKLLEEARIPIAQRARLDTSSQAYRLGCEVAALQRMTANQRANFLQTVRKVRGQSGYDLLMARLSAAPHTVTRDDRPREFFRQKAMERLPLIRAILAQSKEKLSTDTAPAV